MDPNKYAHNKNIKPNSSLKTIKAILSMILMLLGLTGIAVEFFRPSGGVLALIAFVTESTVNMAIAAFALILLYFFHRYITHVKGQKNKKAGNAPMFFMILIGCYYAYRLITLGTF